MGGKSKPSNSEMVQFEKQQAEEARQKEAQRQARLEQGKTAIDALFSEDNFGQGFYDKYKGAQLANNLDQLNTQASKAMEKTNFDLARAGLYRSSAANRARSDIESQKQMNDIALRAKADQDVSTLRQGILGQQQAAYNQLYATEDPEVAANVAEHSVNQSMAAVPNLSPLGELFKPLVIGSIAAGSGLVDQYNVNRALAGRSPLGFGNVENVTG